MGKEVDLVKQSKSIDESPQRLSAVVAKIQMNFSWISHEFLIGRGRIRRESESESDSLDSDFY